ncbi:MAG TPA: hypothetical protein VMS02_03240 [Solirubrobacteraceae bacterium]|nr:hypothetical protein [Solirubrobacteraceae bacterium]
MKVKAGRTLPRAAVVVGLAASLLALAPPFALAASPTTQRSPRAFVAPAPSLVLAAGAASLESAATKAGETGRKVAMSMIALGFAIASIVLAFRRDFREAAGIFAIGIVAILLATPAGVNVLHDTVNALFGG